MIAAIDIYQNHLDRTSQALWERRFDDLVAMMSLPMKLITGDDTQLIEDRETLISWAKRFRDELEALGATAYHRVATAAAVSGRSENRIDGFHRVYVLTGATYAYPPYDGEASLVLGNDDWLATRARAALRPSRFIAPREET